MSDQLDLEELARRYLDLWQEQATALAADPNFAAALKDLSAGGEAAARLGDAVAAFDASHKEPKGVVEPAHGERPVGRDWVWLGPVEAKLLRRRVRRAHIRNHA